ncbi:uncharacterized protein LOC123534717 isoform X2 [Mercenaria mercenaria]|uniref:uncharacterized protein LOC123534717 isoform X2 n=1 Tax=Mercenaria mercenaria TaxID=6596 RepID=UPI00234F5CE1|nr:uncharacterized protein LOC123534717 isoform X2 [Mercenaria mercenaria]
MCTDYKISVSRKMKFMYVYRNVVVLMIYLNCLTCTVDAQKEGGRNGREAWTQFLESEHIHPGDPSATNTLSEDIFQTGASTARGAILDPNTADIRTGNTESIKDLSAINHVIESQIPNGNDKWFRQKQNKSMRAERKKKLQEKKMRNQMIRQQRKKLKQLKKQKIKSMETVPVDVKAKSENRADKPVKWKDRRKRILERMRQRQARLEKRRREDEIRRAQKQRRKEERQRKKAIKNGQNRITDSLKINEMLKDGNSLPTETPVKLDKITGPKRLTEKSTKENANMATTDRSTSNTADNLLSIPNINGNVDHLGFETASDISNDMKIPRELFGITSDNSGILLGTNDNPNKKTSTENLGVMRQIVPGFKINDIPIIDLAGVIDPRIQMEAAGTESGFPAFLTPTSFDPSRSLGMMNTGDGAWGPFDPNTGVLLGPSVVENGVPVRMADANTGIPLGPVEPGIDVPFGHVDLSPSVPFGPEDTGSGFRLEPVDPMTSVPFEQTNHGRSSVQSEHFGVANDVPFDSGNQLVPKEKKSNIAFDTNGTNSMQRTSVDVIDVSVNPSSSIDLFAAGVPFDPNGRLDNNAVIPPNLSNTTSGVPFHHVNSGHGIPFEQVNSATGFLAEPINSGADIPFEPLDSGMRIPFDTTHSGTGIPFEPANSGTVNPSDPTNFRSISLDPSDSESGTFESINTGTGIPLEPLDPRTGIPFVPTNSGTGFHSESANSGAVIPPDPTNSGTSVSFEPVNSRTGISLDPTNSAAGTPSEPIKSGIGISFEPLDSRTGVPFDPKNAGTVIQSESTNSGAAIPPDPINSGTVVSFEPLNNRTGISLDPTNSAIVIPSEPINSGSGIPFEQLDSGTGIPFETANSGIGIPPDPTNSGTGISFEPVNSRTGILLDPTNSATGIPSEPINSGTPIQPLVSGTGISSQGPLNRGTNRSESTPGQSLQTGPVDNVANASITASIHDTVLGEQVNMTKVEPGITGAPVGLLLESTGDPMNESIVDSQNNTGDSGFDPSFGVNGQAVVFQSVDLREFLSTGNIKNLGSNNQPPVQKSEPTQGIMLVNGEIMPVAGRTSSTSASNKPNTASSESKLPASSLLGVVFDISRSLRQGKG